MRAVRMAVSGLVSAVLFTTSGLSLGASSTVSKRDPEDVDGRLDLVYLRYERAEDRVTLTLRTAERWRNRYLSEAGEGGHVAYLVWEFDRDADRGFDCTGRFFRTSEGMLRFERSAPGSQRSFVVERPTKRSVVVRVPVGFCGFESGSRLRAQSVVTGSTSDGVYVEQVDVTPILEP